MIGELTPLVMIPRYTSYVGAATYTTVPLEISEFSGAAIEFWRGQLAGKPQGATFQAYLQEAFDLSLPEAEAWTNLASTSTDDTSTVFKVTFTKRYFRIKIVLTGEPTDNLVAITCWAAGSLERRVPPGAVPQ
jgi:hypothetical protein